MQLNIDKNFILKHRTLIYISIFFVVLFLFIIFFITKKLTEHENMILNYMVKYESNIDKLKAGISQDNIRRRNILVTEKIIEKANNKIPYDVRLEYAFYFVDAVEKMPNVDLPLALAVATVESRFNASARSYITVNGIEKVNAVGIFQLVNSTAKFIAKEMLIPYNDSTRYNARININMGIYYLQFLLNEYDGNVELALSHWLDGYRGSESISLSKAYRGNKEYEEITLGDIYNILKDDSLYFKYDTNTINKFVKYAKAKNIPVQTSVSLPKIIKLKNEYTDIFNKSDIYVTPTIKNVLENIEK